MKTKALRLYGKNDLRLEEFELPKISDDEILAEVITDSVCMSSYKAALQGGDHKRVPDDVSENPIIIGHEFCGVIREVGANWKNKFKEGQKFSIQPAINWKGSLGAPGYSYQYCGGCATFAIIPAEVMLSDALLDYNGDAYFYGSLAEPMSCIVGGYHAFFHTKAGSYQHEMDIREGGNVIIMAGAGPMGLGAVDYAVHADRKPALVVCTDIDDARLERAKALLTPEDAAKNGVKLVYVNTNNCEDAKQYLMDLTDGHGYDDVMIMAPVKPVCELADSVLAYDGCANFFAGPTNHEFSAMVNFYNIHYNATHYIGTSGGNTDDMRESLSLMETGRINPAVMITHVGGIDSAKDTTLNLPNIKGGKKLIYTHINMPMTAIDDFAELGKTDPFFAGLAEITARNNGLWCAEAEKYLLENK
ncbi:MAG: zinc-binding dehydrogenase [Oscillospiraceae bacterium]|nr:zinc-binding dehydrogenase [Oscillospiraceae bacterium]